MKNIFHSCFHFRKNKIYPLQDNDYIDNSISEQELLRLKLIERKQNLKEHNFKYIGKVLHDFNEDSDSPLLHSEELEQRIFNMVERWNIKPWEAMELIHNVDSRQSIEL